jgi:hypothetical protein
MGEIEIQFGAYVVSAKAEIECKIVSKAISQKKRKRYSFTHIEPSSVVVL